MLKDKKKKARIDMMAFWKITIELLLLICGYTTSVLILMNYIGGNM
ncbi:MAG: hypothetical protein ACE5OP_01690 [Candidatus Glassbacteria bacterium]